MSRNLEGQWINFLISCKYFKGGQMPPPPKRNPGIGAWPFGRIRTGKKFQVQHVQ